MVIPCPWPVEHLLPHAPPMVLLDEVIGYDTDSILAVATIGTGHPFLAGDGVPAHVGIELMAQACGAFAGAEALAAGEAVRVGFLLGTRRFEAHVPLFRVGERLEISARVALRDDEMACFDCEIRRTGAVVAEARLNVYQPKDLGTFGGKE
ncbi:MAG: 3-hydroxylacyl-ACP dehydratase [Rhodospirillales bacterium]|nr:3-hydroxylacyl-ACP dehydratase [Rhodospirillales bacterium]